MKVWVKDVLCVGVGSGRVGGGGGGRGGGDGG